jgi:hypothetical protein
MPGIRATSSPANSIVFVQQQLLTLLWWRSEHGKGTFLGYSQIVILAVAFRGDETTIQTD